MYVPEKAKFNKFVEVRIPRKCEYFNTGRFLANNGQYSPDEAPQGEEDKVTRIDRMLADYEEWRKSNPEPVTQ